MNRRGARTGHLRAWQSQRAAKMLDWWKNTTRYHDASHRSGDNLISG